MPSSGIGRLPPRLIFFFWLCPPPVLDDCRRTLFIWAVPPQVWDDCGAVELTSRVLRCLHLHHTGDAGGEGTITYSVTFFFCLCSPQESHIKRVTSNTKVGVALARTDPHQHLCTPAPGQKERIVSL